MTVLRPGSASQFDSEFAPDTQIINDEDIAGYYEVSTFLEKRRNDFAKFSRAPGWYLQQYLKLGVAAALGTPIVFISDGDTIFSHHLLDDVLSRPRVLSTGESYKNYDRLLSILGVPSPGQSCVANGNMFSRDPLLLQLATPSGFRAVIEEHVLPSQGELDFSEYQISGGLLAERLGFRRVKMFRRFDLLLDDPGTPQGSLIEQALRRYDVVAIELFHHTSIAKRLAAPIIYRLGRSW